VTFLPRNFPTPSSSMVKPHVCRHGFIRARSIPCMDALLFYNGKVENLGCQSNHPPVRRWKQIVAYRRVNYSTSAFDTNVATTSGYMTKMTRLFAAILCFAAASLFAVDELAE